MLADWLTDRVLGTGDPFALALHCDLAHAAERAGHVHDCRTARHGALNVAVRRPFLHGHDAQLVGAVAARAPGDASAQVALFEAESNQPAVVSYFGCIANFLLPLLELVGSAGCFASGHGGDERRTRLHRRAPRPEEEEGEGLCWWREEWGRVWVWGGGWGDGDANLTRPVKFNKG